MQKVLGFLRGRHPAQLVGTHQSQACSLISKILVQSNLKSTPVCALFCFSGLEDESVFSWRKCYIAQFMKSSLTMLKTWMWGCYPSRRIRSTEIASAPVLSTKDGFSKSQEQHTILTVLEKEACMWRLAHVPPLSSSVFSFQPVLAC